MGAFTGVYDDEVAVRIPPASPSRRDYQLRSASPSPSRPQSPWRPREEVSLRRGQEIDTFRMYESYPAAARSSYYSGPLPSAPQGSAFYSGPLPSAPQGVDRSYYSGPLPSIAPPSHGGFSTTTTESFDFEFATWAKVYHQQHDSNSVPGSPDVGSSDDEPSTLTLSNPAESRARVNAEFADRAGRSHGPSRNCVSGELGISEAIAQQKSQAARGYKSGEILGLNICADRIYSSSPSPAIEAPERGHTAAWDALMKVAKNDRKSDSSVFDSEMVAIPFKWEEVSATPRDSVSKKPSSRSSSKPNSRTSSVSQKPNSGSSSDSQKPNPRTSSDSQKPNSRTSLVSNPRTSSVSKKSNSRTSSIATAPQKPNSRASSVSTASQKSNVRAPLSAAPATKPTWNTSTTPEPKPATKNLLKSEFSFGGSHKLAEPKVFEKAERVREELDVVAPPALKPLRTNTTARQEPDSAPKSPFSVPFKWEEEPGKAKFEPEEEAAPALQLPPRLAVKRASTTPTVRSPTKASSKAKQAQLGWVSEPESTSAYVESVEKPQHSRQGSGIPSSKKFFDKDCFRRCRRLLVNLF